MRPRSWRRAGSSSTPRARSSPRKASSRSAAFLAAHADFARQPVAAAEIGAEPEWISADGDLRTLTFHGAQSPPELAGVDGFYAARLRRLS